MPSKLKKAIGAVKDQTSITVAKVTSTTSSNLEILVLKATTHDDDPVEGKLVQEILQLVSSNKSNSAACARTIGKRISRTRNWIVVLKSLLLVLRIFQDGEPHFPGEVLHVMKHGARILNLASFRDDSTSSPFDFTTFLRSFAWYLNERLECVLKGKIQRTYSDMKPTTLTDKIAYWQRLLERAIATRPTGAAKTNYLVKIAFEVIVEETFDLYRDISDGLGHVLDSFFHLQYNHCVGAFQTCVRAAKQFEELSAFYSLAQSMGIITCSEYPKVGTISEELLETLQEFLKDQSSFPSCQNNIVLPPVMSQRIISPEDSYGTLFNSTATSDGLSEQTSEFESQCTSLGDLISITETGINRSISINLEAFSESQPENTFSGPDSTTSSESESRSSADYVSGDYSSEDENKDYSSPFMNWELVLAESLSETPPETDKKIDTLDAYYLNPFLQEIVDIRAASDMSIPTFQAIPTFSADNSNRCSFKMQDVDDPFGNVAPFSSDQLSSSSMKERHLQQERELWLQNQNKIIAKYLV